MFKVPTDSCKSPALLFYLTPFLLLPMAVCLQGCMAIPAAALGGAPAIGGLPPQAPNPAALQTGGGAGGPTLFDMVQASAPADATTFAYGVKSLAIGQTTMAQAQQKLGKPIMADKNAGGTSWMYTLADKTKGPDLVVGAAQTTRTAEIYNPGGSGLLYFDNNGILRGVQVIKMSMEGGVSTSETVYSKGRFGPGAN